MSDMYSYQIPLGGSPNENQQQQRPQQQGFYVPPGDQRSVNNVYDAQAKNILAEARIKEANARIAEVYAKKMEIEAAMHEHVCNAEVVKIQLSVKMAQANALNVCLNELKSAMASPKFVEVQGGVGSERQSFEVDAAFSKKGIEALEATYMALYQKLENFCLPLTKDLTK